MSRNKKQQGIINIITVLSIGIFVLMSGLLVAQGVLQQLIENRNHISSFQAFYTAEAAAKEGVYQIINEPPQPVVPYNGGTLIVLNGTTPNTSIDSLDFGDAIISGDANRNGIYREVLYLLLRYPEGKAFSYGLYTPYAIQVSGNATINGNVFATNGVNPDGEPLGSAEINGDIVSGLEPILPQVDDQKYRDAALGPDGKFFNNVADAEQYFQDNPVINNFIFVDDATGKMNIQSTDFAGSLWVTGDLKITGGTFNSVKPYILIIVEGDLEVVGNPVINGIVYVKGSTTIGTGTVEIFGSLICVENTSVIGVNGNITITYDPNIINFWEDIVGLSHVYAPVILNWNEN